MGNMILIISVCITWYGIGLFGFFLVHKYHMYKYYSLVTDKNMFKDQIRTSELPVTLVMSMFGLITFCSCVLWLLTHRH